MKTSLFNNQKALDLNNPSNQNIQPSCWIGELHKKGGYSIIGFFLSKKYKIFNENELLKINNILYRVIALGIVPTPKNLGNLFKREKLKEVKNYFLFLARD